MIEPPLPFGNAAARAYYVLLRGLVDRGHRVTAFAVCSKPGDAEKSRAIFPNPQFDLRCYALPGNRGFLGKVDTLVRPNSYMFSHELRCELGAELQKGFDILHLEQLWCGWLGKPYADRTLLSVHFLSSIDLGEAPVGSWRDRVTRINLFKAERRMLRHYRYIRTCSERLSREVVKINPMADVHSIPAGLESSLYEFIPRERRSQNPVVSIIGSMGWYPSHSAAVRLLTRLWPEIKKQVPNAVCQVVGRSARSSLSGFLDMPDVVIEENVPDIKPYFEKTSVLVYAPSRGSGTKVKIQESLAFGVPVVTTSEGIESLPGVDGVHAGVCEDDAGLIERTVRLLKDPDLQERQRLAGRKMVEESCGTKPILDAHEAIYWRILEQNIAGRPMTA
jgi:polysaccharide biosynthesis protein PslH